MTTTLDDLMNFMKNDKEERVKERESDKQELRQLISGVKAEMEAVIVPLKEKQAELEEVQADMKKNIRKLMAEMKDIQEKITNQTENHASQQATQCRSYAQAARSRGASHSNPVQTAITGGSNEDDLDEKIATLISLGRRTVWLQRIDKADQVSQEY